MKEFAIGEFRDFYTDKKHGSFAIKNIDGAVDLNGSDMVTAEELLDILSLSSGRKEIPETQSGVERILCKILGISSRFSSDGQVTEEMYNEAIKSLPNKKSFKA
jgi:hypothetical protein